MGTSREDNELRRRNVRTPDDDDDDDDDDEGNDVEEMEFRMAERTEDKHWLSLNKCIVGALIMLFLGSLFLGDFDSFDLTDGEQNQEWISGELQDMRELLDKLTQENRQISKLEEQLQSQKEGLDLALKAVAATGDEQGKAHLENENRRLKEELSSLPDLKREVESLRVRVTELSHLTAQEIPTPPVKPFAASVDPNIPNTAGQESWKNTDDGSSVKVELQRQKFLLEESRKRLEGMKRSGGNRKQVRDSLEDIQKRLSEQLERWGKRRQQESKWKGSKGKEEGREHWKKEEKKEQRGEKDWKHGKESGHQDKPHKHNSHKDEWRKHQDEWEGKKDDRRVDREERRKEKPWHSQTAKSSHEHHHHHHHHQQQARQHNHNSFWKEQEEKLRRKVRTNLDCGTTEECAGKEGLYPVELHEFEELLEGYLSKLEGIPPESKDKIRKLTAAYFQDGVFVHQQVLFSDFAEDVADILEDMVDVLEEKGHRKNDALEKEMEEFEREALWKFANLA